MYPEYSALLWSRHDQYHCEYPAGSNFTKKKEKFTTIQNKQRQICF